MTEEMQSETNNTFEGSGNYRDKRKRKKRFLVNAKGFGKKGVYGRGTEVKDDQFKYFIDILDTLKAGFEETDDKVTMANNVLSETTDEEIHLCSNQVVCKAVEALIGFSSAENFERFQKAFGGDKLRPVCSDRFASHVLQKMVEIAFLRAVGPNSAQTAVEDGPAIKRPKGNLISEKEYNTTTDFSEQHRKACSEFVLKIGKFLLNNLEDFLWDPCANHIMRTSINCLGGIHLGKVAFEHSNKSEIGDYYEVPQEWTDVVLEYAKRLQLWPHFPDFPYNHLTAAFMGTLCTALKKIDNKLLKHLGKKLLVEAFLKVDKEDDKKEEFGGCKSEEWKEEVNGCMVTLPKVFHTESSTRLLETLLAVAGKKLFSQLYAMLFIGRLKDLGLQRTTNFSVQRLIENVKEKTDFEAIFTELSNHIEELLKAGHSGVVLALSSACVRLATKQGPLVTSLQSALHTLGSKDKQAQFFKQLLKLKPLEVVDESSFIHIHGAFIIQNILQFNKPIVMVNCILATPSQELVAIFSTSKGSRIADAFITSKFVGEKSREKLIRHLEGYYIDMAGSKLGSRVVENLFDASLDAQKFKIAKELADKINQLNGTMFGRIVCSKLRLETFRLSPTQWKASFNKASKAEKLFKDILKK